MPSKKTLLRLALLTLPILGMGCGINYVGELPKADAGTPDAGPVDAGPDAGEDPNAYPPGPYGPNEGDTIPNFAFAGYVNDHPSEGPVEASGYVENFTFQDIRELERYSFAIINIAAEWCAGCRIEAQQLPALTEAWADAGGYTMSIIVQADNTSTATKGHLDRWINTYSINYTMLHDPDDLIFNEIGFETLPLNIIIDLRTMEILDRVYGEDFAVFENFERLLPGG